MFTYTNLFENQFAKIYHYPNINTIAHIWLPKTTEFLYGKEYQQEIRVFMDFCDRYKPLQLLFDLKDGELTIDLESQEWLQNEVYPIQKAQGIRRKAYVVKREKFDILSMAVRQTAEEDLQQYFEFQYFHHTDDALLWLSKFTI